MAAEWNVGLRAWLLSGMLRRRGYIEYTIIDNIIKVFFLV